MTFQVIFGYGVGGEYPIASSSAAERAEADKQLQFKRGETVILVFAMQVSFFLIFFCCACLQEVSQTNCSLINVYNALNLSGICYARSHAMHYCLSCTSHGLCLLQQGESWISRFSLLT